MTPATWFLDLGVDVFPTVNKVPDVPRGTSWKDHRATREQAARFREYSIVLGLLAVIDTDKPRPEAWVNVHAPETPFKVRTPRGRHRYYLLGGDAPHFIHRDGLTIEFRHAGQYVVGPGSRRPDGGIYVADKWSWNIDDVPLFPVDSFLFDDGSCGVNTTTRGVPYEMPDVVVDGTRHHELFRFIRHVKSFVDDKAQAHEYVLWFNQEKCRPPLVVKDERGEPDRAFETWFNRAWQQRDRPFPEAPSPLRGITGIRGLGGLRGL